VTEPGFTNLSDSTDTDAFFIEVHFSLLESLSPFAAVDGKDPVAGNFRNAFGIIIVHPIDGILS
jgi:hypothetical protein